MNSNCNFDWRKLDWRLYDIKLDVETCYLCLIYRAEDENGSIYERAITNVPLPIYSYFPNIIGTRTERDNDRLHPRMKVDVSYGILELPPEAEIIERIIKQAPKEMTLDEIEEELGYKVKIVNRTENGKKKAVD